ncbi:hypothetical protein ACHAW5_010042 [Stephanodiscus triporus]|uniref:Uncharacterized protein n=1 Tax=Stephanodiscus triporus TaxID=2934178 RepID=A0ABD3QMS2_9STRA
MTLSESISTYLLYALAFPTVFWLIAYLIPQVYMSTIRSVPNLKERYDGASWALVTGSGSGIGRALSFKLADQGLNVVLVSLDDDHLRDTVKCLRERYASLEFRSVGCNFVPGSDYLRRIADATSDIDVRCVFNNAGFIVTGFVDQTPLPKILSNVECNATASFAVAHHFLERMVNNKLSGCVVFTSSVAGFVPTPFAASYAATKAFVSQLACSLHIEVRSLGIDVCAVHPSPVSSNFYEKVDHKIELMEQAQKSAVGPELLPDEILRSIGCCALRDLGAMAWGTRMGTFFIPYNIFTEIFALAAPYLNDYKVHNKNRKIKNS